MPVLWTHVSEVAMLLVLPAKTGSPLVPATGCVVARKTNPTAAAHAAASNPRRFQVFTSSASAAGFDTVCSLITVPSALVFRADQILAVADSVVRHNAIGRSC